MSKLVYKHFVVLAGASQIMDCTDASVRFPMTVAATPGIAGTAKVEYSLSPSAIADDPTASWAVWPDGAAGTIKSAVLNGRVAALRFTAAAANAKFEVAY